MMMANELPCRVKCLSFMDCPFVKTAPHVYTIVIIAYVH